MASFKKDPDDVLDYGVDWSAWLGADTITTSTWFVGSSASGDAPLEVMTSPAPSTDGKTTKVWVRGGTVGEPYQLTNRIMTAGGRTKDRSLQVIVQQQ